LIFLVLVPLESVTFLRCELLVPLDVVLDMQQSS